MTEEQLNQITKGQILYRFPDGVSDSPISAGTLYLVKAKYKNGDLKLQCLPEYLGDTYYPEARRIKKKNLLTVTTPSGYTFEPMYLVTAQTALTGIVEMGRRRE